MRDQYSSRAKIPNLIRLGILYSFAWPALLANTASGTEELPSLPSTITPPSALTLKCIQEAKTFPDLEVCRTAAEQVRDLSEEYNKRITRFCDSLLKHDETLRSKAKQGRLKWSDYEELKQQIQSALDECDPWTGDYFSAYRARISEYRRTIELYKSARESIAKGVGL